MKKVSSLLCVFALLFVTGCKPNLDNPDTLNEILEGAMGFDVLQWRGKGGERLAYAPNTTEPYTGWVKKVYPSGQACVLLQYKNGKMNGPLVSWWQNGQKSEERNYKDDLEHGVRTEWDEEGNITEQTNWVNGHNTDLVYSKAFLYHDNGQVFNETNFKKNKADGSSCMHGPDIHYDENGQKTYEAEYVDGEQHGLETWWDEEGDIISQTKWENGVKVEKIK